jgi:hypothetical protein
MPPPDYQPEWLFWGLLVVMALWGALDLYGRWRK